MKLIIFIFPGAFSIFNTGGTPTTESIINDGFEDMKSFILAQFVKQRNYIDHVMEVFTLDELTRESQAILYDLSTKFQFLQVFNGHQNLTTEVVNEIRHDAQVFSYGQDMALHRITFDQKCRR